jgi:hypothetical protein
MFNVIYDHKRAILAIESGLSFPANRVTHLLNKQYEEIWLIKSTLCIMFKGSSKRCRLQVVIENPTLNPESIYNTASLKCSNEHLGGRVRCVLV